MSYINYIYQYNIPDLFIDKIIVIQGPKISQEKLKNFKEMDIFADIPSNSLIISQYCKPYLQCFIYNHYGILFEGNYQEGFEKLLFYFDDMVEKYFPQTFEKNCESIKIVKNQNDIIEYLYENITFQFKDLVASMINDFYDFQKIKKFFIPRV